MAKSEQHLTAKVTKLIAGVEDANINGSMDDYRKATSALAWWVVRHADRIVITPKPEKVKKS